MNMKVLVYGPNVFLQGHALKGKNMQLGQNKVLYPVWPCRKSSLLGSYSDFVDGVN